MGIETVLADYTKKFGNALVANLSREDQLRPVEVISTGCLAIDLATEKGGVPRGRVTELFGSEAGGKSSLTYSMMARVQANGGSCLYIDMEHKADDEYVRSCIRANGVEPTDVYVVKPPSGTDALDIVKASLDQVDLIVIDSLAALVTNAELNSSSSDDQHWAMTARLISTNIRQIVPLAGLTKTALVGINQVRDSMAMHGPIYRTPGGRAWKHAASLRIYVRRVGKPIEEEGKKVGITCKAKVEKNAIGAPEEDVDFEIRWGLGVDPIKDLVTVAPQLGVIEKSGGWHYYQYDRERKEGVMAVNGARAAMQFLRENPEIEAEIRAEVMKQIKKRG